MKRLIQLLAAALLAAGLAAWANTGASAAPAGTVITTAQGPFGTYLIVGSGKPKGYSVYSITSDNSPSVFGCTTALLHLGGQTLSCTGPENDQQAVWPAVTTTGNPVAGGGVSQALLGRVFRAGIGWQVTYNGHPLYLFDNAPGQITGEGFQDPASPLPHGTWMLVAPNGNQQPWTPVLTTLRIGGQLRLAVLMQTLAGWVRFPAYVGPSSCNAACERVWPEVLSQGFPGAMGGISLGNVGLLGTPWGQQVTYRGRPVFLYSQEQVNLGTLLAAGNGNGIGGFSLDSP